MGAFHGSIQVHGIDRDTTIAAATEVARHHQIRCLVGPKLNQWIGIYPEAHGQDESVGRALAEKLGGHVLHMLVHDDDVFAYWLWRDGQLVDAYWSLPGYFSEEQRAYQEQMRGDPQSFEPILGRGVEQLEPILRHRSAGFETSRLEQFAKLLGIANAAKAYEYLKAGETDGVRGWRQFTEVPPEVVAETRQAGRERRKRINAEKRALRKTGVLLVDETKKDMWPLICAGGNSLFATWQTFRPSSSILHRYRAPWDDPDEIDLLIEGQINSLAADANGQLLATALVDHVVVWDARDWTPVLKIPQVNRAIDVELSPDGRLIAHSSLTAIEMTEVSTGSRLARVPLNRSQGLSLHPSGEWLATAAEGIRLVPLKDVTRERTLLVGGEHSLSTALHLEVQKGFAAVDLDELENQMRAAREKATTVLREMLSSDPQVAELLSVQPSDAIYQFDQQLQRELAQTREMLASARAGQLPRQIHGAERVRRVQFSRNGHWLWCSTNHGIRAWETSAVLGVQGNTMPEPVWQHDLRATFDSPNICNVEEPDSNAIISGESEQLFRLDLSSGAIRPLLTLPEPGALLGLVMTGDGSALGLSAQLINARTQGVPTARATLQILDYRRLIDHPSGTS